MYCIGKFTGTTGMHRLTQALSVTQSWQAGQYSAGQGSDV